MILEFSKDSNQTVPLLWILFFSEMFNKIYKTRPFIINNPVHSYYYFERSKDRNYFWFWWLSFFMELYINSLCCSKKKQWSNILIPPSNKCLSTLNYTTSSRQTKYATIFDVLIKIQSKVRPVILVNFQCGVKYKLHPKISFFDTTHKIEWLINVTRCGLHFLAIKL